METREQIAASISDGEIEILQQLWESAPLCAQDIIETLQQEKGEEVHPKTVKTLINRLLTKGAITYVEKQRKYYYSPAFDRETFYALKTASFVNKFFNGEVSPMVSLFSRKKKLRDKDIAELKKLIAEMEADDEQ